MKKKSSNDKYIFGHRAHLSCFLLIPSLVTHELSSWFGFILEHFLLCVVGVAQPWFGE